jgi:deoxyribodipyrimidine photo-lyase
MNNLIWFRNDLRIQNNITLKKAIDCSSNLEAVYIIPKDTDWYIGEAAQWYLHKSLIALEKDLLEIGITLNFYREDTAEFFKKKIDQDKIQRIFCTESNNPIQLKIDQEVNKRLPKNCQLSYIGRDTIISPEQIKTNDGGYYKVYTPFWNKFEQFVGQEILESQQCNIPLKKYFNSGEKNTNVLDLKLLPEKDWYKKFDKYWQPGERNSLDNVDKFIQSNLFKYKDHRDFMSDDATAKISAAINFGEISTAALYQRLTQELYSAHESCELSIHTFIKQMAWREFAKYTLFHNSDTYFKSAYSYCDSDVLWNGDDILFELWKTSKTGIPIIDSAMQQLREEGWMHNRSRMIVASFLTKNLGIHWLKGATWFWDSLVDADLALNSMGWQWVAGTAPYSAQFSRIFNPTIQTQKYDKKGDYINKYLPKKNILTTPIVSISDSAHAAKLRYKKIISMK